MSSREETLQNELLAWAGSNEGYAFLLTLASDLIKEVEHNGVVAAIWPYPFRSPLDSDARAALNEEVAHDFYLFWVESFVPQLTKHPDHMHLAASGNFRKLFEYARKKFLWQWQDKARSKELNLYGYLYRRLRETLSSDAQFETGSADNGAFLYRLQTGSNHGKMVQTIFPEEGFTSWPIVGGNLSDIPEKEVFKTDYLKRAALFFWNEAVKRADVQAIAVRDLNRYIISQHPWLLIPATVSEPADTGYEADTESQLDTIIRFESMAILAEQLVATWSPQQCRVFLLRLEEPPVKLQTIAETFGWHDHNKVHRLFASCKKSLISFSSNWPGPPLSELPEACGELFLQQVKKSAKNRVAARNKE